MQNRKLKNRELNRKTIKDFREAVKTPLIIILDNIRSLNNVGSVFRTADAFLVKKIYLCGITATPPHRDIQKTALGATDSITWEYVEDVITLSRKLKNDGIHLCAIEQAENAVMLNHFSIEKEITYALIFGNEVKGVQQELVSMSDTVIEIPQIGTKHSLNIAVSTGVVIWDLYSKLLDS